MEALSYEYLIRRAYCCGRGGVPEAEADIYRQMEMSERNMSNPHWSGSHDQKLYDFQVAFNRIKSNVLKAIAVGKKQIQHNISSEQEKELNSFVDELRSTTFIDKSRLDVIIARTDAIFHLNGLTV